MRNIANRSQGTGQPVHRTQPGIRQSEPRVIGRQGQLPAQLGLFGRTVEVIREQPTPPGETPDSVPGQGIGNRPGTRGNVGFQKLTEGIHPAGQGNLRRTSHRQIGIDHRRGGHEGIVPQGFFVA